MAFSSPFYCNNCGAANQKQANYCFYCEEPLFAPAKETLIKQRYRLLGSVGQGGFGAVYRAEETLPTQGTGTSCSTSSRAKHWSATWPE
ncbi:MAG: hypothetical protein E6I90_03625 [Chloroflexi bacterium]|nr:MAG: hypothetical protein E6I90_03625 [Chloroflexota bacterium]